LLYASVSVGEEFNTDYVNDALNRAKKHEDKIKLPSINNETQKAAQKAARSFYSPEYQRRIQQEIERLKKEKFNDVLSGSAKRSTSSDTNTILYPDERIYIFISSSIPLVTLRSYAETLDRINDPSIFMVMRGFVDGMRYFKPTLEFVRNIIVKDTSCDLSSEKCDVYRVSISIDPLLFKKYGIKAVPAIAYARGVSIADTAMSEGWDNNVNSSLEAYVVYGDVSLEYALEAISKRTKNRRINNLLEELRHGFYTK
jgi:type-F conjugative transfer system pilin assembly protein TrbC